MRQSTISKKTRAGEIAARLARAFREIRVPLVHRNPFELLVATILSAQSTDDQVNRVTPALFRRFPDPEALARAPLREIEGRIRPLGLFHSKARALKESAHRLVEEYGSEVPARMEDLTRLKGVGRKTANVVLGHAFGVPGIVVDTHVKRLTRRLGLTKESDPEEIERDLIELLPKEDWSAFSLRLIFHGRKTCHARKPQCGKCVLNGLCPSAES